VESSDGSRVFGENSHGSRGEQAPHSDDLIRGSRSQHPVVFTHSHVGDLAGGSSEREVEAASGGAPHLDQEVVRSGEDILACLVKEEAEHGGKMPEVAAEQSQSLVHDGVHGQLVLETCKLLMGEDTMRLPYPGRDTPWEQRLVE